MTDKQSPSRPLPGCCRGPHLTGDPPVSLDGIWESIDFAAPAEPRAAFDHQDVLVTKATLRVDCFDPGALGSLSGVVTLTSGRLEEFRAEGTALVIDGSGCCIAMATTHHPRVFYSWTLRPVLGGGHHYAAVQRLQLVTSPGGCAQGRGRREFIAGAEVGGTFERCHGPAQWRKLNLNVLADPAIAEGRFSTKLLEAFSCGRDLANAIGMPKPKDVETLAPTVEAALQACGLAVRTTVGLAERPASTDAMSVMPVQEVAVALSADGSAGDELRAWSSSELDAVMNDTIETGPKDVLSPWEATILVAPRFADRPAIVGTMFSTASRPRRGCALFLEPAGQTADAGLDRADAIGFCAVHEIGHLLNLLHSFEADRTEHRRQQKRPECATFMNYPNRYPFGAVTAPESEHQCRDLFWSHFRHGFSEEELAHLRHGWDAAIRPGRTIEPLMAEVPQRVASPGLAEAAAESFRLQDLRAADPAMLQWLSVDIGMGSPAAPTWDLRLPNRVLLGEPVQGSIGVTNHSDQPQLIPEDLDPAAGLVAIDIEDDQGGATTFVPARQDCGAGARWLQPGDGLVQPLQLSFGWTAEFSRPGRFRITARPQAGDGQPAVHELIVERPTAGASALLDRLFEDERVGLALVGEGVPAPTSLDALGAGPGPLPPSLAALLLRCRVRSELAFAGSPDDLEALAFRLHRLILEEARRDRYRLLRLQYARELQQLALALLRYEGRPPPKLSRCAARIARSALSLMPRRWETVGVHRESIRAALTVATRFAEAGNPIPHRKRNGQCP